MTYSWVKNYSNCGSTDQHSTAINVHAVDVVGLSLGLGNLSKSGLSGPPVCFHMESPAKQTKKEVIQNCFPKFYPTLRMGVMSYSHHYKCASISTVPLFVVAHIFSATWQLSAHFSPYIKYAVTSHPFSKWDEVKFNNINGTVCYLHLFTSSILSPVGPSKFGDLLDCMSSGSLSVSNAKKLLTLLFQGDSRSIQQVSEAFTV